MPAPVMPPMMPAERRPLPRGSHSIMRVEWVLIPVKRHRRQTQLQNRPAFKMTAVMRLIDRAHVTGVPWWLRHHRAIAQHGFHDVPVEVLAGVAGLHTDTLVDANGELRARGNLDRDLRRLVRLATLRRTRLASTSVSWLTIVVRLTVAIQLRRSLRCRVQRRDHRVCAVRLRAGRRRRGQRRHRRLLALRRGWLYGLGDCVAIAVNVLNLLRRIGRRRLRLGLIDRLLLLARAARNQCEGQDCRAAENCTKRFTDGHRSPSMHTHGLRRRANATILHVR